MLVELATQLGLVRDNEHLVELDGSNYARLRNMRIKQSARERECGTEVASKIWWQAHKKLRATHQRAVKHWFLRASYNPSRPYAKAYERVLESLGSGCSTLNLIEVERLWANYAEQRHTGTGHWIQDPMSGDDKALLETYHKAINNIERRLIEDRCKYSADHVSEVTEVAAIEDQQQVLDHVMTDWCNKSVLPKSNDLHPAIEARESEVPQALLSIQTGVDSNCDASKCDANPPAWMHPCQESGSEVVSLQLSEAEMFLLNSDNPNVVGFPKEVSHNSQESEDPYSNHRNYWVFEFEPDVSTLPVNRHRIKRVVGS